MANNTNTQTDPARTNPAPRSGPDTVLPSDGLGENHPLRPTFGVFHDNPTWEEFMENIREYRRQLDAQELAREKAQQ